MNKQRSKRFSTALKHGINFIDTAPVYGLGRAEELVGHALAKYGKREEVIIATKVGLEWRGDQVFRNSTKARIMKEIDDSLRRLKTDYIDIYQVHWPDPLVPIEETAEAMHQLYKQGKIRAIGVSNYSLEQISLFQHVAPLHTAQPPYNLFERGVEKDVLPYCRNSRHQHADVRLPVPRTAERKNETQHRIFRRRCP